MLTTEQLDEMFTPSENEQILLILKGECPHNKGWKFSGHCNYGNVYQCKLCDQLEFY